MSRDSEKIRNVGPKSAAWLRQVGIRTHEDLARIGALEAFLKVKRAGFRASLNLLYSMEGALQGCHWQQLSEERRAELQAQFEAADQAMQAQKAKTPGRVIDRSPVAADGGDGATRDGAGDDPGEREVDGALDFGSGAGVSAGDEAERDSSY